MITIQEPTFFQAKLVEGVQKAQKVDQPILVSFTSKIDPIDPLIFFSQCERLKGTRTFWADHKRERTIVGAGIALSFEQDGADRFQQVQKQWQQIVENAIVISDTHLSGIGPTMIGGFSFDPLKEKTDLWKAYPDAKLTLHKYMLTHFNDEAWLTTNFLLTSSDDPRALSEQVSKEQKSLFSFTNKRLQNSFVNIHKKVEVQPSEWLQTVKEATAEIRNRNNEIEKIVLARELRVFAKQPFVVESVLKHLLREQATSYIFAFESEDDCFVVATPERLVKRENKNILFTSLAGSMKRGDTEEEDQRLGNELLTDKKNLHEHQLVVDLITTIAEDMCTDVQVPEKPSLYKIRDIQHLYTPITARAKENDTSSLLAIVEALHPTPALGGYPQKEAVVKIRDMEQLDRGWYAAPIGWLDYEGNGEFACAIRSALVQGKEASLFAGCGLVSDSEPESEYAETVIKFKPMLSALGEE